jgi:hypothetical protein
VVIEEVDAVLDEDVQKTTDEVPGEIEVVCKQLGHHLN